jgi:hypothetical protein
MAESLDRRWKPGDDQAPEAFRWKIRAFLHRVFGCSTAIAQAARSFYACDDLQNCADVRQGK